MSTPHPKPDAGFKGLGQTFISTINCFKRFLHGHKLRGSEITFIHKCWRGAEHYCIIPVYPCADNIVCSLFRAP